MRLHKEWIINGVLVLAIVGLVAGIVTVLTRPTVDTELTPSRETPTAPEPGDETVETNYDAVPPPSLPVRDEVPRPASVADVEDETLASDVAQTEYRALGKRNIFRPIMTPSPTPTPAPPAPTPTPSLARAVQGWSFQYPNRLADPPTFVFLDKEEKEVTLTEGRPYTVQDDNQEFQITAESSGKYAVTLKYGDQKVTFSLIE